jgi:hypothetical protein
MFWAVVKISMLSFLKSSETIKREEKVLDEAIVAITGTFVSFFSVETIYSATQRAKDSIFADSNKTIP